MSMFHMLVDRGAPRPPKADSGPTFAILADRQSRTLVRVRSDSSPTFRPASGPVQILVELLGGRDDRGCRQLLKPLWRRQVAGQDGVPPPACSGIGTLPKQPEIDESLPVGNDRLLLGAEKARHLLRAHPAAIGAAVEVDVLLPECLGTGRKYAGRPDDGDRDRFAR